MSRPQTCRTDHHNQRSYSGFAPYARVGFLGERLGRVLRTSYRVLAVTKSGSILVQSSGPERYARGSGSSSLSLTSPGKESHGQPSIAAFADCRFSDTELPCSQLVGCCQRANGSRARSSNRWVEPSDGAYPAAEHPNGVTGARATTAANCKLERGHSRANAGAFCSTMPLDALRNLFGASPKSREIPRDKGIECPEAVGR